MYLLIGLNIILKRSRNCLLYTKKETNGRVVIVNTLLHYINLGGKRPERKYCHNRRYLDHYLIMSSISLVGHCIYSIVNVKQKQT